MARYILLLLIAFVAGLPHAALAQDLGIKAKTGTVRVSNPAGKADKATLSPGSTISVSGNSRIELTEESRELHVTAEEETELKYLGIQDDVLRFDVLKGKVDFSIKPGNKLDVVTPHMVASVRGTAFTVEVSQKLSRLGVRSGSVEVSDRSGGRTTVHKGEAVQSTPKGLSQKEAVKAAPVATKASVTKENKRERSFNFGVGRNSGLNGGLGVTKGAAGGKGGEKGDRGGNGGGNNSGNSGNSGNNGNNGNSGNGGGQGTGHGQGQGGGKDHK
ncbi:FecR domain-containing protein [Desulfocurvibacter africanus]|nr:FecR domain-containing protein [Desulfocurvibacter africanus]